MSPLGKVLAVVAGALMLAVLAMWLVRSGPMPPERAAAPEAIGTARTPPLATPAADPDTAPLSVGEAPPPWSQPPSAGSAPSTGGASKMPDQASTDVKSSQLLALQRQLMEVAAQGQSADPKKLDDLLAQTIRVNGGSNVGGVNLDVLRQNLAVASKMQAIAEAMQRHGTSGSQPDATQLQADLAELVQLQKQIRTDVMASPLPAPPPVGR